MRTRRITASAGGWPRSRAILTSDHPSVKEPERRSRSFTPRPTTGLSTRNICRSPRAARARQRRFWPSATSGRRISWTEARSWSPASLRSTVRTGRWQPLPNVTRSPPSWPRRSPRATRAYESRQTTAASSTLPNGCRRGWNGRKWPIDSWRRIPSPGSAPSMGPGRVSDPLRGDGDSPRLDIRLARPLLDPRPSAEGEAIRLHAGGGELDLEEAVVNSSRLSDQLVGALLAHHPAAVRFHVRPVRIGGELAIEEDAERDGRSAG